MDKSKVISAPASGPTRPRPAATSASSATACPANALGCMAVIVAAALADATVLGSGRHATEPPCSNRSPNDSSRVGRSWPLVSHHCVGKFPFARARAKSHRSGTPSRPVTGLFAGHRASVIFVVIVYLDESIREVSVGLLGKVDRIPVAPDGDTIARQAVPQKRFSGVHNGSRVQKTKS